MKQNEQANKALQAIPMDRDASVSAGMGDWLLPGFRLRLATAEQVVAASFPAPVPELKR